MMNSPEYNKCLFEYKTLQRKLEEAAENTIKQLKKDIIKDLKEGCYIYMKKSNGLERCMYIDEIYPSHIVGNINICGPGFECWDELNQYKVEKRIYFSLLNDMDLVDEFKIIDRSKFMEYFKKFQLKQSILFEF